MASAVAAKGRGRGRARQLGLLLNNPGGDTKSYQAYTSINGQSSKLAEQDATVLQEVVEALDLCLRKTAPENMKSCLSKVEAYASDDERLKSVVRSLFEKCLVNRNMASNGGLVAANVISSSKIGQKFRNVFLKQFQDEYAKREATRKNDFNKYLCLSILLCSIFQDVKINGGAMKILAKPVYNILKELLDKHDLKDVTQWEEATEVFRKNLFNVVLLLSDTDESQIDELFQKIRTIIVRETSPKVSCILLEMFEIYTSGGDWKIPVETDNFYNTLMSEIIADNL